MPCANTVVPPYRHTWISPWKITKMLLRCLHKHSIPSLKAEAFRPSWDKGRHACKFKLV